MNSHKFYSTWILAALIAAPLCAFAQPLTRLEEREFGKMPDGTSVKQFTLRNSHGMVVKVMSYGAIITAVIMFIFGSGPVRGYAITLCAGIIVSMYTALVLTRLIFEATMKDTTKPYKMMRWIKDTAIDFMAPRKIVFIFSTAVIIITMAMVAHDYVRGNRDHPPELK